MWCTSGLYIRPTIILNIYNNNLMLISRKFTFIYDQMRVTTVEIKITAQVTVHYLIADSIYSVVSYL